MPPLDQCHRILRGELTKLEAPGPLCTSTNDTLVGEGFIEFRHAVADGSVEQAVADLANPPGPAERARQREFAELADGFIDCIRAFRVEPETVVTLIVHYTDGEQATHSHPNMSNSPPPSLFADSPPALKRGRALCGYT